MARQTQLERNTLLEAENSSLRFRMKEVEIEHNKAMNAVTLADQAATRDLQAQLTASEKALADSRSTRDYYSRLNDETSKELSALHTILDFLPGAPPRKIADQEYGSQQPVPLVARFAAFLAAKS
jgi:hypothetical protein